MRYFWIIGLFGFLFCGCQANDGDQQANEALVEDNLPADFVSFYEEFHRDSSFQMDRIIWPLEGVPDNAGDRLTDRTFRWQRNEWRIMQPTDVQSSFQREFLPLSNELIIEKITNNTGQFALIRRWAVISGDWHLIYYAGMNPVRQGE